MRIRSAKLVKPYTAFGKFLSGTLTHEEGYILDYKQGLLTVKHPQFEQAAEGVYPKGQAATRDACCKIPAANVEGMTPWTLRDDEREKDREAARKAAEAAEAAEETEE